MQKNVANQKFTVYAFDSTTGLPTTGDAAQITVKIRIDGGLLTGTNDVNPTEGESGYYDFDALQAETNGDEILIVPVSSTSNIVVVGVPAKIITTPVNYPQLGIETDGDITKVNLVDTTTTNSDMRGTDSALTDKDGFTLSAAGIDAILDETIGDGTITMRQSLLGLIASLASKVSGGGTATIAFRNNADSKDVITMTVDANGNRSAVTFTP